VKLATFDIGGSPLVLHRTLKEWRGELWENTPLGLVIANIGPGAAAEKLNVPLRLAEIVDNVLKAKALRAIGRIHDNPGSDAYAGAATTCELIAVLIDQCGTYTKCDLMAEEEKLDKLDAKN
jgi:hypothetical protein